MTKYIRNGVIKDKEYKKWRYNMKEFSEEELSNNNGKNGTPPLIVYHGNVYDLSGSYRWEDGNHENIHEAGKDLTEELDFGTPHDKSVIYRFPIIGILKLIY